MAAFLEKSSWKLLRSEKFDDYMKACGIGAITRKLAAVAKSSLEFRMEGETWTMATKSPFKNTVISFKIGEEFDEITADGRKMKTTVTLEGDSKLIQTQKGDIPSVITRTVRSGQLIVTCEAKGVVSTRIYD